MTVKIRSSLNINELPVLACKYLNYMALVQSASPQTLRAYASDLDQAYKLKNLGEFRVDPNANPPCSFRPVGAKATGKLDADALLKTSRDAMSGWSELSPSSRNRKGACLKSFLYWMFQEGQIDRDLSNHIHSPKIPARLPHFISLDEALALLKSIDNSIKRAEDKETREEEERVKALVLLLYGGGLRVSEASSLRWTDVKKNVLHVEGKGGKERLVTVPGAVTKALSALPKAGAYVFGKSALNTRVAYSMIRGAGSRAGLIKPLHPHALRHSFATHLLASGANLRTLQELLGHTSLAATQKYTHLGIDQLARTLEKHHPLAGKGRK